MHNRIQQQATASQSNCLFVGKETAKKTKTKPEKAEIIERH